MKKIIFLLSSIVVSCAFAQGNFKFVEETHDFGKVPEGDSIAYEFEFTNVGDQPITITNVQPSCGCTVPKWPSAPIQPGAKGNILAKYATKNRVGAFTKYLTINSDALEPSKQIKFVGEVLAAPVDTTKKVDVNLPEPQPQPEKKAEVKKSSSSKPVQGKKSAPTQKKATAPAATKKSNSTNDKK